MAGVSRQRCSGDIRPCHTLQPPQELWRQRQQHPRGGLGAPVLLMHPDGQDGITANNLEDNELWTRHVATAVSQITVSTYAFIKSWPQGGDTKLLQVPVMLFFVGIVKCMEKPLALKNASINSLVSPDGPAESRANRGAGGTNPLQNFVQQASQLFFVLEHKRRKARRKE
jgi:hypothetical protein